MSAFKDWIRHDVDPCNLELEDVFEAGRKSVIGNCKDESYSIILSSMDREVTDLKIRLAGVLSMLHADGIISYSKMMQLSDMTAHEIAMALKKLKAL